MSKIQKKIQRFLFSLLSRRHKRGETLSVLFFCFTCFIPLLQRGGSARGQFHSQDRARVRALQRVLHSFSARTAPGQGSRASSSLGLVLFQRADSSSARTGLACVLFTGSRAVSAPDSSPQAKSNRLCPFFSSRWRKIWSK